MVALPVLSDDPSKRVALGDMNRSGDSFIAELPVAGMMPVADEEDDDDFIGELKFII